MTRPKEFDTFDGRIRREFAPRHLRVITVFGQDELLELTLDTTPVRHVDESVSVTDALMLDAFFGTSALLQENGDYVLQENGDKILLEIGNG